MLFAGLAATLNADNPSGLIWLHHKTYRIIQPPLMYLIHSAVLLMCVVFASFGAAMLFRLRIHIRALKADLPSLV